MASRCRTQPAITRSTASGSRRRGIIPACSPCGDGWLIQPLNRRTESWHSSKSINADHSLIHLGRFQTSPTARLCRYVRARRPRLWRTYRHPSAGAYSSTSWEIKGLQVHGGRVLAETDDVELHGQIGEFTRSNCVKDEAGVYGPGWTEWHDCPSGQLMTGVRVYRYEDKWFTGISAICKIPQRSVPPRKPVKDSVGF